MRKRTQMTNGINGNNGDVYVVVRQGHCRYILQGIMSVSKTLSSRELMSQSSVSESRHFWEMCKKETVTSFATAKIGFLRFIFTAVIILERR